MTEVLEDEEGSTPMSEHVQVLAKGIYDELQPLVEMYGTESIVSLMPLVVNILEQLDSALADNKTYLAALEETNDENQQLTKEYNKEKHRRKEIEGKSMKLEDLHDLELRELRSKVSTLNLANKNQDSKIDSQKKQISHLEERQDAVRKENIGLRDKNIELIKNFEVLKQSASAKIAEARSKSSEEFSSSPTTAHAPGYHDFAPKGADAKKKRHLPIAPHRKPRSTSAGSTEGEGELLLATTPYQKPDSPEYMQGHGQADPFDPNHLSLHAEEQHLLEEEEDKRSDGTLEDEDLNFHGAMENFTPNEDSLMAEFELAASSSVPGMDQIVSENERLHVEKSELNRELDEVLAKWRETEAHRMSAQNSLNALSEERSKLTTQNKELESEVKTLRIELGEEREKNALELEGHVIEEEGKKLTKVEIARMLRERKEYKEKYLSLLEQIRMNDELSHFKSKGKKSRWVDYFAALFSPAKRRQLEQNISDATPRRGILSRRSPGVAGVDEDDGPQQFGAVGYRATGIIPILRKTGKRQDEVYMTSVAWVIPTMDHQIPEDPSLHPQPNTPSISACRPMSYQEEGAKVSNVGWAIIRVH